MIFQEKSNYELFFRVEVDVNGKSFIIEDFVKIPGKRTYESALNRLIKTSKLFNSVSPKVKITNAGVYKIKEKEEEAKK